MWFEIILVFILFKCKKYPNISGIRIVELFDESPLCISKVTGQPAHGAADSNTIQCSFWCNKVFSLDAIRCRLNDFLC